MRHAATKRLMMLLLVGLAGTAAEARPLPPPLDLDEFLDAEEWFQSGLALNGAGKYSEAAEAFARSVAIDPKNPLAWLNLGTAQALSGAYGPAISSLREALRLDPKLALAYSNLGEIYFKGERYAEALEAYGAVVAIWPKDANAHYKLGLAYLHLDNLGKAQAEYLSLKILDPDLASQLLQAIYQRGDH